ncbi:MAG: SprT-like domain-containing protein [Planctomycetota bacterium]
MLSPLDLESTHRRALDAVASVLGLDGWPEVPVRWNRRLRRAGRAVIQGSGRRFTSAHIELSPAYFEVYPGDLFGILVHEAVHVGLAIQGRPFGHGRDFRDACRAAGGLLHGRSLPGRVLRYRCPVCGTVLERRRLLSQDRWCAACVDTASRTEAEDPYAPERALVLVGLGFSGPEPTGSEPQEFARCDTLLPPSPQDGNAVGSGSHDVRCRDTGAPPPPRRSIEARGHPDRARGDGSGNPGSR